MATGVRAVGISWFREEDYVRARALMVDKHVLAERYADWKQKAEATQSHLEAQGHIVYRAIIDPDDFPAWCRSNGLDIDAKARMAFASDYAMRQVGQTH